MLIRLRYASILSPETTSADVDDIVIWSAKWNRERHVTGVLAVQDGRVMQILEGPDDIVSGLFDGIRRDMRHEGVVELDRLPVPGRRFAGWAMVRRSMAEMLMMSEPAS